jgi:hypothetical protein
MPKHQTATGTDFGRDEIRQYRAFCQHSLSPLPPPPAEKKKSARNSHPSCISLNVIRRSSFQASIYRINPSSEISMIHENTMHLTQVYVKRYLSFYSNQQILIVIQVSYSRLALLLVKAVMLI